MKCIQRFSNAFHPRYTFFDYSHRYLPWFSSHVIVLPFRPLYIHTSTRELIFPFSENARQRKGERSDLIRAIVLIIWAKNRPWSTLRTRIRSYGPSAADQVAQSHPIRIADTEIRLLRAPCPMSMFHVSKRETETTGSGCRQGPRQGRKQQRSSESLGWDNTSVGLTLCSWFSS